MKKFYIRLSTVEADSTRTTLPLTDMRTLEHLVEWYAEEGYHAERLGNIIRVHKYSFYTDYVLAYDYSEELLHYMADAATNGTWKQKSAIVNRTALAMADSIVRHINSRGC